MPRTITIVLALVAALSLASCSEPEPEVKVTEASGQTMGTYYKVTVYGDSPVDEEELKELAEEAFQQVIDAISTFDGNSEISRFNKRDSTEPMLISPYLADVIEYGRKMSIELEGTMDFTVSPLVDLWGFGPLGKYTTIPTDEQIREVLAYVGFEKYELERTHEGKAFLVKKDPRVQLDLSTIGEGLGVDLVYDRLFELGARNFLISVAGASKGVGVNAKGVPFRIGIEQPSTDGSGRAVHTVVCPNGMAMSTAGSYRNFYEEDGKYYSHVIDPLTGRPVDHKTVSVTVIDRSAMITDAIDTGLMVMGAQKALEWADMHEKAIFVIEVDDDGNFVANHSPAFEQYLKCK